MYNENYFETINENSAYVLGFILADGNILCQNYSDSKFSGVGYHIRISLNRKDRCVLEYIQSQISPNKKIYDYVVGDINKTKKYDHSSLVLSNKKLVHSIMNLGILPNKTHKESLPLIDNIFYPDLIRGFFDGDGCIKIGTQTINNKEYFKGNLKFVSGGYKILEEIKSFLNNVGGKINKNPKDGCFRYQIQSKKDIITVAKYMYTNDNAFCLKRKKDIFNKIKE